MNKLLRIYAQVISKDTYDESIINTEV